LHSTPQALFIQYYINFYYILPNDDNFDIEMCFYQIITILGDLNVLDFVGPQT